MKTLGIIMAKGKSIRTPGKNIADVCGNPAFSYPLNTLRNCGICDEVIVSTDDDTVADIAKSLDAPVVRRDDWWDKYPQFAVSVHQSLLRYEQATGKTFETLVACGANVLFLRQSWLRAAYDILYNYLHNKMPINIVSTDSSEWKVVVGKVRSLQYMPDFFHFDHKGMLIEFDWQNELDLAIQLMKAVNDGHISYPDKETIHEDALFNMAMSPNQMGTLSKLEDL